MLSCIIVTCRTPNLLVSCVSALLADLAGAESAEIVVVDLSPDGSDGEELRRRLPSEGTHVMRMTNRGYGAACNHAALSTSGDPILFLNADVIVDRGALQALLQAFDEVPDLGIVGFRMRERERDPAPSRFLLPKSPGRMLVNLARHPRPTRAHATALNLPVDGQGPLFADWVLGAALACRRRAFLAVGGFDERFFLYFEDVDLCRRVKTAGCKVAVMPTATAYHVHGASTALLPPGEAHRYRFQSQVRYFAKHHGALGWLAATLDRSCLRWRI